MVFTKTLKSANIIDVRKLTTYISLLKIGCTYFTLPSTPNKLAYANGKQTVC